MLIFELSLSRPMKNDILMSVVAELLNHAEPQDRLLIQACVAFVALQDIKIGLELFGHGLTQTECQ